MITTTTPRGFALIQFEDRYGHACSLQESSLATERAIWLGIDDPDPKVMAIHAVGVGVETTETTGWVPYPLPSAVSLNTRMHLTREQVASLLPALQHFVDTGDLSSNEASA